MNWISLGGVFRGNQMLTIQFFERRLKRNSPAKAEQQVHSTATIACFCVFFSFWNKSHISYLFIVFTSVFISSKITRPPFMSHINFRFVRDWPFPFQFFFSRMNGQIKIVLIWPKNPTGSIISFIRNSILMTILKLIQLISTPKSHYF